MCPPPITQYDLSAWRFHVARLSELSAVFPAVKKGELHNAAHHTAGVGNGIWTHTAIDYADFTIPTLIWPFHMRQVLPQRIIQGAWENIFLLSIEFRFMLLCAPFFIKTRHDIKMFVFYEMISLAVCVVLLLPCGFCLLFPLMRHPHLSYALVKCRFAAKYQDFSGFYPCYSYNQMVSALLNSHRHCDMW